MEKFPSQIGCKVVEKNEEKAVAKCKAFDFMGGLLGRFVGFPRAELEEYSKHTNLLSSRR